MGLPLVPSYLISTPSQISSLHLLVFPSLSVRPHRVIAAAPRGPFTPIPDPAHRQERGGISVESNVIGIVVWLQGTVISMLSSHLFWLILIWVTLLSYCQI